MLKSELIYSLLIRLPDFLFLGLFSLQVNNNLIGIIKGDHRIIKNSPTWVEIILRLMIPSMIFALICHLIFNLGESYLGNTIVITMRLIILMIHLMFINTFRIKDRRMLRLITSTFLCCVVFSFIDLIVGLIIIPLASINGINELRENSLVLLTVFLMEFTSFYLPITYYFYKNKKYLHIENHDKEYDNLLS